MTLPSFLVIGAMKAGSTTLFEDLRSHPSIYLPEKELDSLGGDDATTPRGKARYEHLFASADSGQVPGQVSSPYAKLPDSAQTVEHAADVLGDQFKVIYLVRDPVDRVVSHHLHDRSRGILREPLDDVIRSTHRLLDWTRYAMQISPWVDLVGADRVRVVPFERYVADRPRVLDTLFSFLGVDRRGSELTGLDRAHNRSSQAPAASGSLGRLLRSRVYRSYLRPMVPQRVRQSGTELLASSGRPHADRPSHSTVDLIIEEIAPELPPLSNLCGPIAPHWDLEGTRRRYLGAG